MAPSALTGLGGVSRGSKLSSNIYYRKDKSHENDESEAPNNSPSKPLRQNSASPKHDSTQVPVAVVSPDFERAMDMAKFANKGTSSADRKTRFMQMMLTWLHTDSLQDDIRVERVARLYKHHKRRMSAMPLVHWTKDLMDKDSKVKALDEIETVHKNRASMKDLQTLIPSKPTPSTTPRPLSASTSYRPSIWDTTALLAVRALLAFKSLSSPSSKNKRQAAAAAARAQHQALQQKKERVIAKQRALKESHDPPCEQDVKMRDDYLTKQRNNLIAKKKAQREKELDSFKSTNDEFEQMINRNKGAKASATPQDSDNVESARDQLRQDLARKLKQELMHKSLSRLDGIKPKAV
mmetsp:Transcript_48968/g.93583  ORF Transcript_48968/g.93583 Transcript_48968/m.93583 type:complete len:351 (+) Transcript_48968:588-1640(+)